MKILVCISHVPDTTTRIQFDPEGKSIDKTGVQFVINPYDEFALSYAVGLKEKNPEVMVDVLCVGLAEVEPTIRKALAIGADKGIRIDRVPEDGFIVAQEIANYVRGKGYDLILLGKESIDFNGSQVAGMVAELLDLPFISFGTSMEIQNGKARVKREVTGGSEWYEVSLPLVLSAQKGLAEWRIPNMKGIMMAKRKPLEVIPPQPLEPMVKSVHFSYPPGRTKCHFIDPNRVEELVQILVEKGALN